MTTEVRPRSVVPAGVRAQEWWQIYCQSGKGGAANRARLRRCRSNTEAAAIPAAVALARRLDTLRTDVQRADPRVDVALGLARVLAHVKEDVSLRPMRAAGWKRFPNEGVRGASSGDQPRLADARFRRLLEAKRGEELVTAFVRLVALLGGTVKVSDLSDAFIKWERDEVRRRWAFDYYAAAVATPRAVDIQPSEDDV